jgi:hypothetical protein
MWHAIQVIGLLSTVVAVIALYVRLLRYRGALLELTVPWLARLRERIRSWLLGSGQ